MFKKICAVLLTVCMLSAMLVTVAPAEDKKLPFTDIKKGWYYEAVEYVYELGIMKGTEDTKFSPNVSVTRAMFVAMLGRLHGAEEVLTDKFPDVNGTKKNWYNGYVGWANENGIITGYDNGKFGPDDEVTREQMATIISRYIDCLNIVPKLNIDAPAYFHDASKVSRYAKSAVEDMRLLGIIKGTDSGDFDPKSPLTRASAATIIMRLHKMIKELELGDALTPDYTVAGKNFALMGAWDLYYSGTALDTSYTGVGVATDASIPYITEDANGQMFHLGNSPYRNQGEKKDNYGDDIEVNTLLSGNYYEIDMKIACIDPAKYPVLRFAYRADGNAEVKFGMYADNATAKMMSFTAKSESIQGWSYGIVDLTGSGTWSDSSIQITPTIMSEADIDLLYFAAFPDTASAEAFDVTDYSDELAEYDGEVVTTKAASKADVDAALAKANDAAEAIINSDNDIDPSTITGTCYYISNDGDDTSDGKSPETAWKSFVNLFDAIPGTPFVLSTAVEGDAVFLERGSVFNENTAEGNYIDAVPGVTYSAYGEGAKPVVTRELPLDTPTGTWFETKYDNIWKLDLDEEIYDNPGNIVFVKNDGTELWGVMTIPHDPQDPYTLKDSNPNAGYTEYYGVVSNGEDTFESGGVRISDYGCLKNNLEYYGDIVNGGLYLYYDGDPSRDFKEIHISLSNHLMGYREDMESGTTLPTRIDNIAFKYAGGCGIATGSADDIYITNCTFEWIGGAYQDGNVRYGNAIQNWGSCDGIIIKDCYFKDIYDAAVTTQGGAGIMRNFYASGCVLDRCDLSFEFFNHDNNKEYFPVSELVNIFITDNYVINNGVGYCDVRTDRRSAFLYTTYGTNDTVYENIVYENNVNIFSAEYAIYSCEIALGQTDGTILRNNTYYMDPSESHFGKFIYNMIDRTGSPRALYPYTSQYLTYLNSIGVEVGSTFYTTTNPDLNGDR